MNEKKGEKNKKKRDEGLESEMERILGKQKNKLIIHYGWKTRRTIYNYKISDLQDTPWILSAATVPEM